MKSHIELCDKDEIMTIALASVHKLQKLTLCEIIISVMLTVTDGRPEEEPLHAVFNLDICL